MKDRGADPVQLAEHLIVLAEAVNSDQRVPAGRLLGLPELPDDDYWVDIAGAAAIVGVRPNTITSWLVRGRPARNPFPQPRRYLYRLYWPSAEIRAWQARNHSS
jgi:predicted DNA-binding transcriptional regulator AlpA